jgi:hypothetical protein
MGAIPARIHVLLARNARVGLVIRRGPSKSVATLLWNRRTDEFQLGQWMRGRIYERRCDLSPDGKRFLYFAMNGKWESEALGSWTAISHAPYLKALAMLPKGDCWNGGGLWTGNCTYWLNDGHGHQVLRDTSVAKRDNTWQPSMRHGGECPGVYYPRLVRDGWTMGELIERGKWKAIRIFEKPCAHGWVLRKLAHAELDHPPGKGCYWDEHELVRPTSGWSIACPRWEWAELDGRRLVWAEGGQLHAGRLATRELVDTQMLHDFNDMTFTRITAPY